ncbi:hypothetical protein D3C72_2467390 [compost metagenome]
MTRLRSFIFYVSLITVVLKDPVYDFQVVLNYKTYFKDDVVEQWAVIRHKETSC